MASLDQFVFDELAAQGVSVDAEPLRRPALVALGMLHHDVEKRLLDDVENHVVHRGGLHAAQVLEIALQAISNAFFDVLLAHACCSIYGSFAAPLVAGSNRCESASSSNQSVTART